MVQGLNLWLLHSVIESWEGPPLAPDAPTTRAEAILRVKLTKTITWLW